MSDDDTIDQLRARQARIIAAQDQLVAQRDELRAEQGQVRDQLDQLRALLNELGEQLPAEHQAPLRDLRKKLSGVMRDGIQSDMAHAIELYLREQYEIAAQAIEESERARLRAERDQARQALEGKQKEREAAPAAPVEQTKPTYKEVLARWEAEQAAHRSRRIKLKDICTEMGANYNSVVSLRSRYGNHKRRRKC